MQNRPYAGLIVKVALLYFTLSGVCQGARVQSDIHFRLVHNSLIIVSVMAGKEGPFDFVLDTGADTSVVDPSITLQLSVATRGSVQQSTLAGVQMLTTGRIPSLTIGSIQAVDVPVLVQNLSELRKMDTRIVGIVGEAFLSRFNYMLDYDKGILRFERNSEIQDSLEGDRLAIGIENNRMFVRSEVQSRIHANLRLLLDSGANSLVLLHTASELLQLPLEVSGVETTSSGHLVLQIARVHELIVGSEKFHDLPAALPAAEPSEHIGDGLLPTVLFHTLYVNSRERFVILNPHPKKN